MIQKEYTGDKLSLYTSVVFNGWHIHSKIFCAPELEEEGVKRVLEEIGVKLLYQAFASILGDKFDDGACVENFILDYSKKLDKWKEEEKQ